MYAACHPFLVQSVLPNVTCHLKLVHCISSWQQFSRISLHCNSPIGPKCWGLCPYFSVVWKSFRICTIDSNSCLSIYVNFAD